jgi:hypothetical protein
MLHVTHLHMEDMQLAIMQRSFVTGKPAELHTCPQEPRKKNVIRETAADVSVVKASLTACAYFSHALEDLVVENASWVYGMQ